jgi:hypothetical protein
MWALVADVLIKENITKSKSIDKKVTMSTYLQTWFPITNATSTLPPDIRKMLNTRKKYNLCFNALRIPEKVKKQLPAWYHLGAENTLLASTRHEHPNA